MDLITIFKILWRRRWILIGVTIISATAAILLTAGYEKDYKSSAQLATGFTVADRMQINEERFNIYEADVKFNNLIETMRSSRILSLLSYKLIIHDIKKKGTAEAFTKLGKEALKDNDIASIDFDNMLFVANSKLDSMSAINTYKDNDRNLEKLLKAYEYDQESLRKKLSITRVRGTDYVSVSASTKNPLLSAYMVNELCDQFLRYNATNINENTSKSVQSFARLVDQKKEELSEKSEMLRQYKASNSLINFSIESESKIQQLSDFELRLEAEQKNLRSITLQLQDVDNSIRNLGGGASSSNNSDILNLRRKISNLNKRYVGGGSSNQQMLDSLNELRLEQQRLISIAKRKSNNSEDLEKLNERKNSLEVEKQIAGQNIAAIRNNIRRLKINVGGYASKESQIASLEREVNLASEEYKIAQERYNNALDVSSASGSSIKQIIAGLPASEPEASKRLIVTALSGVSSFTLGVLIILILAYVDVSIKSVSNFNKTVPLKLLGSLSHLEKHSYFFTGLFKNKNAELNQKESTFKEFLRKLRYELDKFNDKIFLFTSTKSQEGKTTALLALANALSSTGKKTLIIDMNFKNNELTRVLKPGVMLENILITDDNRIKLSVSNTNIPHVDVIGCKTGSFSPFEKFDASIFKPFLKALREKYEYIFIEAAALNDYADSQELSEYVEGIITVVSAKSVHKQPDRDSIAFLNNLENKNKGAILNDIDAQYLDQ